MLRVKEIPWILNRLPLKLSTEMEMHFSEPLSWISEIWIVGVSKTLLSKGWTGSKQKGVTVMSLLWKVFPLTVFIRNHPRTCWLKITILHYPESGIWTGLSGRQAHFRGLWVSWGSLNSELEVSVPPEWLTLVPGSLHCTFDIRQELRAVSSRSFHVDPSVCISPQFLIDLLTSWQFGSQRERRHQNFHG